MWSAGGSSHLIGEATNIGDVFVTPARTGFANHGHVGIYYTTTTFVEAPSVN